MQDLPLIVCLSPNGKEASGFAMSTFMPSTQTKEK